MWESGGLLPHTGHFQQAGRSTSHGWNIQHVCGGSWLRYIRVQQSNPQIVKQIVKSLNYFTLKIEYLCFFISIRSRVTRTVHFSSERAVERIAVSKSVPSTAPFTLKNKKRSESTHLYRGSSLSEQYLLLKEQYCVLNIHLLCFFKGTLRSL